MRRSRLIMLSCALLALGCSDLTAPSRLDGAWREQVTGGGLDFTLATNADSITGTGSWSAVLLESTGLEGHSDLRTVDRATGKMLQRALLPDSEFGEGIASIGDRVYREACCGGPVTVAGTTTQGNVTLTLSFVAIGNVVPPWSATFTGRLSDANTLAGTMRRDAASAPV